MADPLLAVPSQPLPLVSLPDRDRPGAPWPVPLTSFVGRAREIAALADLLRRDDVRLVTLTGPGGVGKTRLALAAAGAVAGAFPDGVRFVDLAPIADPALVLPTVAQALGLRDGGDRPPAAQVAAWLAERCFLLVLDNLEQVVAAAADLAALLGACPAVTILATSRVVLRATGEQVYPVPPLALPDADRPIALPQLASSEAVALFVTRAQATDPAFALTEANAAAVAAICRCLDGLPLAIELAATRVRFLSPPALLVRLTDRLRVLTGGPRDQPDRLRTIRNTIAWSHDLLAPQEQVLFRRLAVFAGGCTLEAAEAVCDRAGDLDVFDGLAALVDQSLIQQVDGPARGMPWTRYSEPRFRMLETVREYGLEKLAESGEEAETRAAHAAWCLDLAERAKRGSDGPEQLQWLDRLDAEHGNLRAALGWAVERGADEVGLRLVIALWTFWLMRGHVGEGRRWAEDVLTLPGAVRPDLRAHALDGLGVLANMQDDFAATRAACEESAAIYRGLGDVPGLVFVLNNLANVAITEGDLDRARGDIDEAMARCADLDDSTLASNVVTSLGLIASVEGDHDQAESYFEEALVLIRQVGHPWLIATAVGNVAAAARVRGDLRRAADLEREALARYWDLGDEAKIANSLENAAIHIGPSGDLRRAARLLGAAARLREVTGITVEPLNLAGYERNLAAVRDALGDDGFAAAWAAGREVPLDSAVIEAEAVFAAAAVAAPVPDPASAAADPATHVGLSPRELEVVRLVAQGRSNQEIADALFVSHGTARTHVQHVLNKLGLDSRTAVAAWAIRHGLA